MSVEVGGREGLSKGEFNRLVSSGRLISVGSSSRDLRPILVGEGVSTKVNANVGTSTGKCDLKLEVAKAEAAVSAGADAIMDLSVGGDLDKVRRTLLKKIPIPLGTVPVYQVYFESKFDMNLDSILNVIERQARDGVDFMTIHAGITQSFLKSMRKRIIPITSRGGGFIASWMLKHGRENPLYTGFDQILEVLKEYGVCLSLGDALRPGAIADAHDDCQIGELKILGKLTERAWSAGVQVMVEGPGHVPIHMIEQDVVLQKKICHGAPYYVLGPLVTDIGLGHDHITSAIGGAIAASAGADFLCYVTPSEHLGLPDIEDVRQGVVASKIAAHAGDIAKYGDMEKDIEMSRARRKLDWEKMFDQALDPQIAKKYSCLTSKKECSMCGEYCVLKLLEEDK